MPDVPERLAQFFGDLRQRASIEKIEAQSLALIDRQRIYDFLKTITPKNSFRGIIAFRGRSSDHLGATRLNWLCVKLAALQVAPPIDGPMVRHLDDPGPRRAFGAVEDPTLPLDIEKQVLDEVFCLGCIPQDADGYASSQPCVALEESGQSFAIANANLTEQGFVGRRFHRRNDVLGQRIAYNSACAVWKCRKAECGERIHPVLACKSVYPCHSNMPSVPHLSVTVPWPIAYSRSRYF